MLGWLDRGGAGPFSLRWSTFFDGVFNLLTFDQLGKALIGDGRMMEEHVTARRCGDESKPFVLDDFLNDAIRHIGYSCKGPEAFGVATQQRVQFTRWRRVLADASQGVRTASVLAIVVGDGVPTTSGQARRS